MHARFAACLPPGVKQDLPPLAAENDGKPKPTTVIIPNRQPPSAVEPKRRLLRFIDAEDRLWLFKEGIPGEGTRIDRLYRYARLARRPHFDVDRPAPRRPGWGFERFAL